MDSSAVSFIAYVSVLKSRGIEVDFLLRYEYLEKTDRIPSDCDYSGGNCDGTRRIIFKSIRHNRNRACLDSNQRTHYGINAKEI